MFRLLIPRTVLPILALAMTDFAHAHPAAHDMARAAATFLDALTPEQRTSAQRDFDDDAREDWHFVPRRRAGLTLGEMTPEQRSHAFAVVRSALSAEGFDKVSGIVALESVLARLEGGGAASFRDPDRYTLLIAGTPDPHGTWAWRFEGHHLSLNITIVRGEAFAVTPSFFGANPAEIPSGPERGRRVLRDEEDIARALMHSFSEEQRTRAWLSRTAPREIITGADRRVDPLHPPGIGHDDMSVEQRAELLRLVETYVHRHRAELAERDLARIRAAGVARIHFAWAGGLERGEGHYYRVQGPTFLLEYDNTQNGANHIHTVWREFEGDFGRDLLREHHARDHAADEGAHP